MVTQPHGNGAIKPPIEFEDPSIIYPYEDGKGIAETPFQFEPLTETVAALQAYFNDRPDVYVSGASFVYYQMNVAHAHVAPDVFVVFGASGKHPRNAWFTWREGNILPNFVMEIAHRSTCVYDATEKRDIYAYVGVPEYWRFDPTGHCFRPPLIGERLVSGEYQPVPIVMDDEGIIRGHSDVLGLDICVRPGLKIRLSRPTDGSGLRKYSESEIALNHSEAKRLNLEAMLDASRSAREQDETMVEMYKAEWEAAKRRIRELEAQLQERNT